MANVRVRARALSVVLVQRGVYVCITDYEEQKNKTTEIFWAVCLRFGGF